MFIELLLSVQLQTYPRAEVQKTVETKQTELVSATDAEPNIRKLAEAGSNLELIEKGKVAIVVGESEVEKKEKEAIRQQEIDKSALKRNVGAIKVVGTYYGWCTDYVKSQGKYLPSGYDTAGNLPAIKRLPQVGDAMVTYEGRVGHVVLVTSVNGDYVKIREANYIHGAITERTINWKSNIVKGFI